MLPRRPLWRGVRLADLAVIAAATAALLAALGGLASGSATVLLGLLLVGFAPGYGLLRVLGDAPWRGAAWIVRCALTSLVLTVLLSAVTSALGLSLSGPAVLIGLWLLSVTLSLAGALRSPGAGRAALLRPRLTLPPLRRVLIAAAGPLLMLVIAAWAWGGLARAAHPQTKPFTSFSVTELADGCASGRCYALVVANHESVAATYHLEAEAGGALLPVGPDLVLAPGEQVAVRLPSLAADAALVGKLSRAGDPQSHWLVRVGGDATRGKP